MLLMGGLTRELRFFFLLFFSCFTCYFHLPIVQKEVLQKTFSPHHVRLSRQSHKCELNLRDFISFHFGQYHLVISMCHKYHLQKPRKDNWRDTFGINNEMRCVFWICQSDISTGSSKIWCSWIVRTSTYEREFRHALHEPKTVALIQSALYNESISTLLLCVYHNASSLFLETWTCNCRKGNNANCAFWADLSRNWFLLSLSQAIEMSRWLL